MKRIIFFPLLTISSFLCSAQKDFRNGFIVTLEKDTVQGQIDYQSNARNSKVCIFKDSSLKVSSYSPLEILGYGYNNDKFYSSEVIYSMFVEALVFGNLALYKFKDDYYIKKGLHQTQKLEVVVETYSEYKVSKTVRLNTKWLQIFSNAIVDCYSDPNELISGLTLREKELINAVSLYNECKNSKNIVYKELKTPSTINFGVVTGVTFSKLKKLDTDRFGQLFRHLENEYQSTYPFFGLMANFSAPRFSEKISFQQEFHYSQTGYSSTINTNFGGRDEVHVVDISLSMLSFPFALRYETFGSNYAYVFYFGGNFESLSGSETKLISDISQDDGSIQRREYEAFELAKSYFGTWLGAGIRYNFGLIKSELGLRYVSMGKLNTVNSVELETRHKRFMVTLVLSSNKK